MNDPRWFKLLLRAIGVLTIAISLPRTGDAIRAILLIITTGPGGWTMYTPYNTTTGSSGWLSSQAIQQYILILAALSQLTLGLYLLSGAPRLARFCIGRAVHRCPACDYDTRGLKGACPECGLPIPTAPDPPATP